MDRYFNTTKEACHSKHFVNQHKPLKYLQGVNLHCCDCITSSATMMSHMRNLLIGPATLVNNTNTREKGMIHSSGSVCMCVACNCFLKGIGVHPPCRLRRLLFIKFPSVRWLCAMRFWGQATVIENPCTNMRAFMRGLHQAWVCNPVVMYGNTLYVQLNQLNCYLF